MAGHDVFTCEVRRCQLCMLVDSYSTRDKTKDGRVDPFEAVEDAWLEPLLVKISKMKDGTVVRFTRYETLPDPVVDPELVTLRPGDRWLIQSKDFPEMAFTGLANMGPLPDPTVKMDTTNLRQEREDRAREIMETEAESTLAILYQALYARGMRIGTVQQDIKRALEKEEKGAG